MNVDCDVIYISESGTYYSSQNDYESHEQITLKNKIWYKDVFDGAGEMADISCYQDRIANENYYTVARAVCGRDGQILGTLMIANNERQIYENYRSIISDTSNLYVVDPDGYIVSSNVEKIIGFQYFNMDTLNRLFGEKNYISTRISGRRVLFTKYYDPQSHFTVFEEIALTEILDPIVKVRNSVMLVCLISLFAGVFASCVFSRKVTVPIKKLSNHVLSVEAGCLDKPPEFPSFREINDLNRGIGTMLERIRLMIESEKIKNEQKRRMEITLLQAQINLHFMYNTLFSIRCMVEMNKNDEAAMMLASFIQILRSTLSNPDEFDTIENQLRILQKYVDLQQFRYDNKFEARIECDDASRDTKIPKLIIQPLVENAIFHGIEAKKGIGLLTISARACGNAVRISVSDNGVGMSEDTIRHIMHEEDSQNPDYGDGAFVRSHHIGIKNVHDRIQLHFGSNYGVEITSRVDFGTRIDIIVPRSSGTME